MILVELNDDRSEKVRYNDTDYPILIRRGLLSEYPNYSAPVHWHKVQSSFLNIWTLLYENIPPESRPKAQNADLSILKNMIGFIQQNYTVKMTLADIAASGSVGQSKCCKLFAKYIGQTPNVYLTQYRLNKSTELLKKTDMTVTEISDAVGFGGSSYYAESFRKWSGKSPSEYRKNT